MASVKKCGFVALMGRPNAGKSTLMNALVGRKLAAVSRKPQTTRNPIQGIVTTTKTQMIFVDTPGLHRLRKNETMMNAAMNKEAWRGGDEADAVVYLISCVEGWHREDAAHLQRLLEAGGRPPLVFLSQVDRIPAEAVRAKLTTIQQEIAEALPEETPPIVVQPLSAKRREHLQDFCDGLAAVLPEAEEFLYPEDYDSDRPVSFYCGELIREQVFRQMGKEIPHQCGVLVEQYEDKGDLVVINAKIITARENHKGMVVGQKGRRIKEIGIAARQALEKFLEQKVHLELLVSVDRDWFNRPQAIKEIVGLE